MQRRIVADVSDRIAYLVKEKSKNKFLFYTLLNLPILVFFYQYLFTGSKSVGGDFDYYAQLYEAFRLSVLHYHQLPLWNPWMSGGVPLFANPQFGLFSLQSLLVLPFGAIYGLKLTYVIYAILGFWGMYHLLRRTVGSTIIRSVLISYIWIFCGFWAGHNISHFTTASLFLLPWLILLLQERKRKYSWLLFGLIVSIILLDSIDFVFLMVALLLAALFIFQLSKINISKQGLKLTWGIASKDVLFLLKSGAVVILLAGYRFYMSYIYVSNNPRPPALLDETHLTLSIIFKAIFLPIGSFLKYPKNTQWGWGEYSMYMGMGVSIAFFFITLVLLLKILKNIRTKKREELLPWFVWAMVAVGFLGFLLALGSYGHISPYHILKSLPGYSQTRVSSRWLFLTAFSMLVLIASYKHHKIIIDTLLFLSFVELFFTFGPPRINGGSFVITPSAKFNSAFEEYDNGRNHLDMTTDINDSYFYATSRNLGQIYSDEPFADTLDRVVDTNKCGINTSISCTFVMTHNAKVVYWSPNKILIKRSGAGEIVLNMNLASGWRVNNSYPFAQIKSIAPSLNFVLSGNEKNYTLQYAPKYSPEWLSWRISKI